MHKVAKEIMDRLKSKINSCGIDGIEEKDLIEMKYWACIANDMVSYDYHYKIIEEMDKADQYGSQRGGERYYTPRYSEMRRPGYDPLDRDMDMGRGRMYYTDYEDRSMRGYSDSRYDMARRGYEEAKQANPNGEDMNKLKDVFDELKADMKKLSPKMTNEAKMYARSELNNMANTMI